MHSAIPPGVWVDDSEDDDPLLRRADGSIVDTCREDFPYADRLDRDSYEHAKRLLQVELLKLQYWVKETGGRIVVLFEGRDAAGKAAQSSASPSIWTRAEPGWWRRGVPTERERGQWYFQRYVEHLPTTGEIVMFDRSWYNHAVVELVMSFCTQQETETFLRYVPAFEQMLIEEGIALTKFWFSVTRSEERTKFAVREVDPIRQWKLSETDIALLDRWDDYTAAKITMFRRTHTTDGRGPWSGATTRNGPGWSRCAACCPGSTTTAKTMRSSETRTR